MTTTVTICFVFLAAANILTTASIVFIQKRIDALAARVRRLELIERSPRGGNKND